MASTCMTMIAEDDRPSWLSIRQTATRLGVATRTVYGLINTGRLPGYRLGRVIRVRQDDLDAYLESVRIRPGSLDHLCNPPSIPR